MYKEEVKVYGEDLYNGSTAGIVKAQGNMGGLVVRVFAKEAAASVASTDVTVKEGATSAAVTTTIATINAVSATPVKAGEKLAEVMLPWDVAKYVTASVAAGADAGTGATASTNLRVTLGYLPR